MSRRDGPCALDGEQVLPAVAEVVGVEQPVARPAQQLAEEDPLVVDPLEAVVPLVQRVHRLRRGRAEERPARHLGVVVGVVVPRPAHGGRQHLVLQHAQRHPARDAQPAPDERGGPSSRTSSTRSTKSRPHARARRGSARCARRRASRRATSCLVNCTSGDSSDM